MSSSLSSHEHPVIETIIKLNHSTREIVRSLNRLLATITYELSWINHGLLKVKVSDLPDKGIRRQRQSDGHRRVFAHVRSIERRPKSDEIEQDLGIPMYFSHPYSPEERGSNEVLNWYVHRFIPKQRKIETVSKKRIGSMPDQRKRSTGNYHEKSFSNMWHVVFR